MAITGAERKIGSSIHAASRITAIVCVVLWTACTTENAKPAHRDTSPKVVASSDTTEKPLWVFGQLSVRTDTLPAELDSLVSWGEYDDGARPVAVTVDLNGDGTREWLVRGNQSLCGRMGCPTVILTRSGGRFVDVFDALALEVYATDRRSAGWPNLWIRTGGRDGGVIAMKFKGGKYELDRTLIKARDLEAEPTAAEDSVMALLNDVPSP